MLQWYLVCGLIYLAIFVDGSPTQISTSEDSPTTKTTTDFQAVFASSSETCTKTVKVVQSGLKKGDTTVVYSSVETFHATVQTLQATVEQSEFDSHSAVTYSAEVVEVVTTYSTIVTTLSHSDHPSMLKDCHGKLKEIKVSVQKIINAYVEVGVCVKELVEKKGGIDIATLSAFDLQLDLDYLESEDATVMITEEPVQKKKEVESKKQNKKST